MFQVFIRKIIVNRNQRIKILHPIVKIALFILAIKAIEPPLRPERFSQSMTVDFGDLITTGKYWYDSRVRGQRYDFQNGNTKNGCGSVHQVDTPCSYLIQGGWFYMVYPQKNLCCKLYEAQILRRNLLSDFTFSGEKQIDGELFEMLCRMYCIMEIRERRKGQDVNIRVSEFIWTTGWRVLAKKRSVFDVPSYCMNRCWNHFQSQDEFRALIQNLKNFNLRISSNSSTRFQSQNNQLTVS